MNAQVSAIKSLLDGLPQKDRKNLISQYTTETNLRLYRMADAARALSVSRSTLWRMVKEGEIKTVEIRKGSKRIPAAELLKFSEK